jgi:hypothetical protein
MSFLMYTIGSIVHHLHGNYRRIFDGRDDLFDLTIAQEHNPGAIMSFCGDKMNE